MTSTYFKKRKKQIIDNVELNQHHQNIENIMGYIKQNTNESLININTTERTNNDIATRYPVF